MMPIKSNELVTIPKKRRVHKPQTEAQKRATEENYALFQLKSMLSNLIHIRRVDESEGACLDYFIRRSIARIKSRQNSRQVKRKLEKEKSNEHRK